MPLTNKQCIQKIMDTLAFFSNRIESFQVNEQKETIIRIINVDAQIKVPSIPQIRFGPDPHESGELKILMDLVSLMLEGRYKDRIRFNAICQLSATNAKHKSGFADVDLVLLLDPGDNFPTLNKAYQNLKQQLKEFAESTGLPHPWSK